VTVSIETPSVTSKHRNTASQRIYDNLPTVLRSGAPEVSYISTLTGRLDVMPARSLTYTS
jgi:hypothetical protein